MSSNIPSRRAPSSAAAENGVNSIGTSNGMRSQGGAGQNPAAWAQVQPYGPAARDASTAARGPRDASIVGLSTPKRVTFQHDKDARRLLEEQQSTIVELKEPGCDVRAAAWD